jgi:thiol-disulfide isomerase/thioredoxin
VVDVAVSGAVPDIRRGRVALAVAEPAAHAEAQGPYRSDAADTVAAAFADAADRDVPVLVDFTAVWCPPCNLLAAEVLHDPRYADLLENFSVVQVDVDDPSSWDTKDRYQVGGYPTVVVATAEGEEIDRMVGYGGARETEAWLQGVLGDPAEETGSEALRAGKRAWLLVQQGREEDARPLLESAAMEPDHAAFRLARINLEPTLDDARWLADHAPGTAVDWVYTARDLSETEKGRVILTWAIQTDLRTAEPSEASDLLYTLALIEGEPGARSFYGAALAALRGAFSGDPERDRGHWTWYAELLHLAGDTDGAIAFLDAAEATFPNEPTWSLKASRILLDAKRFEEALARTERGLELSWGDNHLRMATLKVEALIALGRAEDAAGFGRQVLDGSPVPVDGLEVRTHRYRTALTEALEGGASEEESPEEEESP